MHTRYRVGRYASVVSCSMKWDRARRQARTRVPPPGRRAPTNPSFVPRMLNPLASGVPRNLSSSASSCPPLTI
jgi:hypothetical protein